MPYIALIVKTYNKNTYIRQHKTKCKTTDNMLIIQTIIQDKINKTVTKFKCQNDQVSVDVFQKFNNDSRYFLTIHPIL